MLGFKEWDLVDQLWDYFVNAFGELRNSSHTQFLFPDQPFEVSFIKKSKDILLLVLNGKTFTLNFMEFSMQMLKQANNFYENLLIIFPEYNALIKDSLEIAQEIKMDYGTKYFNKSF